MSASGAIPLMQFCIQKLPLPVDILLLKNSSNHQWIFGPIDANYAQVGGLYGTHTGSLQWTLRAK